MAFYFCLFAILRQKPLFDWLNNLIIAQDHCGTVQSKKIDCWNPKSIEIIIETLEYLSDFH